MDEPIHILVVDDSGDDALLLMRELGRGGYATSFERVDSPELMVAALERQDWDVVIADHSMLHFGAASALELIQERNLDLPFFVVSGSIGEEAAEAIMKEGAHDFFAKDNLVRLIPAIKRELHEA